MIVTLLGGMLGFVSLAGCTTTSRGQPQPSATGTSDTTPTQSSEASTPRSTSPTGNGLPSDGAPKVTNPLDTSRYRQNPCQILTPAQLQELNLRPEGEQRQAPLGLACDWRNQETGGNVHLQWTDQDPRGLSAIYGANKAGKYKYFMELPEVEGYPAVASDATDGRDLGDCSVQVGTSDEINFYVSVQLSRANVGKKDPCAAAVQAAGMAVRTMKAGG
jgi:hypothetical protein